MIQNSGNTVHVREYFKILRSRFWVIFTIFLLTVISGAYVTEEVLAKIYEATAQIQIKPRGNIQISTLDQSGAVDRPFDATNFQAEFEIMQSPKVLSPVIADLGLDKKWAKTVWKQPSITQEDAIGYLGSLIKIEIKRGTDIVSINVSDEDAQEAADIANAIAKDYKAMRDDEESDRSKRGTDTYSQQITDQQSIVDDRRAKVNRLRDEAYKKGLPIDPRAGGMTTTIDTDLDKEKQDLLSAKLDADARGILIAKAQSLNDDDFVDMLTAMGRINKDIQDLRSQLLSLKSEKERMITGGLGENNTAVLANEADQEAKSQQIKGLIAGQRQSLAVDVQMAKSRVDLLQRDVDDLTRKAQQSQTTDLVPYREAENEYAKQMGVLDAMNIHLKQQMADFALMESPVRIIARATPPQSPSKPNNTINLLISVLAGVFLGVLVAFLVEYLDTSVKTMADAESLLGLPVLTVIPNKGGPMPLNPQSARLPHAEGYRILRAKLDLKVQNGVGPSVSMLSGGPGEGKSTTIYNLSVICAQAGQSVILVDCDLRRPMVHKMVDVPNDKGLANYFRGEGDPLEYIQPTALPNLHVLTAGEVIGNEIGALVGDKIRKVLDELKQRYDVVLVDSPPVLGISDGSIIAREIDYVILVIQHRRYPREISLRAKRAIEEVHGNCVGMVLNCVAIKSDDSYYYYSNYGNYYQSTNDRQKKKKKKKVPSVANGSSNGHETPVAVVARKDGLDSEEF